MGKRIRWERIEHIYVTGDMSYKELSTRYKIPSRTLSEEAKKREWVQKRKSFRAESAAEAIGRARAREADKLDSLTQAADRMADVLNKIMEDEKQLHLHTGIVKQGDAEYIQEKELVAYNKDTIKALTGALKDMTQVLRNLHGIQTVGEEENLKIQRERLELEKAKAGSNETDNKIEFVFEGDET